LTARAWPDGRLLSARAVSFDGTVSQEVRVARPEKINYFTKRSDAGPAIARGAGLSYAAASFGGGATSVDMTLFDRILGFDTAAHTVWVEAGVRLDALHAFLITQAHYLPVQPGYGRITIGGCIGADVHGKHQAVDGTFLKVIKSLRLFHPAHGILELSCERDPELFRLTVGGYGLTGIVIDAVIEVRPLSGNRVTLKRRKVRSFEETIAALGENTADADLVYSWHDMGGDMDGRGTVTSGVIASAAQRREEAGVAAEKMSSEWRARGPALINRFTSKAINAAYKLRNEAREAKVSLREALFPIHGMERYFKLYGARGFHEHQALIPVDRFEQYCSSLREASRRTGAVIALASAKLFAGEADLLRFSGNGVCFAINTPRTEGSQAFLDHLDDAVIAAGGLVNLIKNSHTRHSRAEQIFPGYDEFKRQLTAFDPNRLFRSSMSERLGL
jgi:decaprenylphospho-beta-D-ribofuranose 2-oxidase